MKKRNIDLLVIFIVFLFKVQMKKYIIFAGKNIFAKKPF